MPKQEEDDCNRKSLKCVPDDVMKIIIKYKSEIMVRTTRTNVSFEETLYKIVREWGKKVG